MTSTQDGPQEVRGGADEDRANRLRVDVAVALVATVAAYLVRRQGLPVDGLAFDDAWVVAGATKGDADQLLTVSTNHPGFTAALMVWDRTVSERSELFAWIPFVFGVAAPAATYLVAARSLRVGRWIAGAVSALLIIAPEHAIYSGRVKPYVIGTLLTIALTAALPALAARRWTWATGAAWVAVAVVVGSIEALSLVVTAVAVLVLAAHPNGDRAVRYTAVAVQGVVQLAMLVTVQGRFASGTIAEEWETTYDGYVEFDHGPVSAVRQIGAHVARLGQTLVPESKLVGVAVVVLAVAGLAWRAWRGSQRIAARFLSAMFVVAFVGGLVRQIPFGPSIGNPAFPGGRAGLWMLPAIVFGLAFALDGLRRLAERREPRLGVAFGALVLVGALVVAVVHVDDERTYPLPGAASAARDVRAGADDGALLIVFPSGRMSLAAEPGIPVRIVADTESHQGFDLAWTDRQWRDATFAEKPIRFIAEVRKVDRVLIHNGLAGYGDQQLPAIEKVLQAEGFEKTATRQHGIVTVEEWRRSDR